MRSSSRAQGTSHDEGAQCSLGENWGSDDEELSEFSNHLGFTCTLASYRTLEAESTVHMRMVFVSNWGMP